MSLRGGAKRRRSNLHSIGIDSSIETIRLTGDCFGLAPRNDINQPMSQELIIVVILALIFDFLNGMRDVGNIVATMISSRAFGPQTALSIASIAEFIGPFL